MRALSAPSPRRAWALALAPMLVASIAHAEETVSAAACIAANEQAGPLRRAGKLRESRAELRRCGSESCPAAVRNDCVAAAAQADLDMPTVTFSAEDSEGNDLTAVSVSVDGELLASRLDGKAVEVDPGEHLFRFETPGEPVVEKRLLIVQGEKNRRERVHMGAKVTPVVATPMTTPPPVATNKTRVVGLGVGGAGLGLLGVGGVAAAVAYAEWSAAKSACGPTFPVSCLDKATANSDRNATASAGLVADIGLGLGAAAFVTGAVIVLLAPPRGSASARLNLAPEVGPLANGVVLRGAF